MERHQTSGIAVDGGCVVDGVGYAFFANALLAAPHARFGFPEIRQRRIR
jgi:enoyl-CoA hydratase